MKEDSLKQSENRMQSLSTVYCAKKKKRTESMILSNTLNQLLNQREKLVFPVSILGYPLCVW